MVTTNITPDAAGSAQAFFDEHIRGAAEAKGPVYEQCGFSSGAPVLERDWLTFLALLLGVAAVTDSGRTVLPGHVVMIGRVGASVEYSYESAQLESQLAEDRADRHVFVAYTADLSYVEVRHCGGDVVIDFASDRQAGRIVVDSGWGDSYFQLDPIWIAANARVLLRIEREKFSLLADHS